MLSKENTVQELKNQLHKQVESLKKEQLVEVYKFISKMIGRKLMEEMDAENLSRVQIQEAIKQHRRKHPYNSGKP